MKKKGVYLAADAGGSKTTWLLIKEDGDIITVFNTEGLGAIQEGILDVSGTVQKAAHILNQFESPQGLFLSLGGPNVNEVINALKENWPHIPVTVEREACGDAILYAASFLGCSGVVMCGTGSVAVGDTEKGRCFSGGWGPLYGDGGSAGGVGISALRLFLKHLDRIENMPTLIALFSNLTEGVDVNTFQGRMEVKKRATQISRRELAALSIPLYKLAMQNDPCAVKLYQAAIEEVISMAFTVSDNTAENKILLCGGFFKNKPEVIKISQKLFAEKSSASIYYDEAFCPIVAAAVAVLKENKVHVTPDLFYKILKARKD